MRTQTIWVIGAVMLAACGGSSPAFCESSIPTARVVSGQAGHHDVGDFAERDLDISGEKPASGPKTRDGDTAGAWWMSHTKGSTPYAKR